MTQSGELAALVDAASAKLFDEYATPQRWRAAEQGQGWPELWRDVEASGFLDILCTEDVGPDQCGAAAFSILRNAGRALTPAPLGETIIGRRIFQDANAHAPGGPIALGTHRAAYGRHARHAVVEDGTGLALARVTGASREDQNVAGEPRDDLRYERIAAGPENWTPTRLRALAAAMRAATMCGVLERVLTLTVEYARTRKQFGRPIGQFQAIQQSLAVLAGHTAAASVAARFSLKHWNNPHAEVLGPVAKLRAGEAAGAAISIAHQTFGAIGITEEHELHFATRRLHAWRAEFGGEGAWGEDLGRWAANLGPVALWPAITAM